MPDAAPSITDLGDEKFVSLTTYRRSGAAVPTPVWVARDGDALVVWTGADSGKVKRLSRDPRVELAPCDRRGRVRDGAPVQAGVGEIIADVARRDRLARPLAGKYGLMWHLVTTAERVMRRGGGRVVLRITSPQG